MIKYIESYKNVAIVLNTKTKKYSLRKTVWPHSLKTFISTELAKSYVDKDIK